MKINIDTNTNMILNVYISGLNSDKIRQTFHF